MNKINIYRSGELIGETSVADGDSLLDAIKSAGIYIDAPCGGRGHCGKCLVQLTPGGKKVQACQTRVQSDMSVYIPEKAHMQIAGNNRKKFAVSFTGALGVGVDIGTTTVVVHLTQLSTGTRIATASSVNAQKTYGADVISRITYSEQHGHEKLTRLIRDELNDLILETCLVSGADSKDIVFVSIAGNTIMQHLAAGYSPVAMGKAPYTPVSLFGDTYPAWEGMPIAETAKIYFAPCVQSYLGGDITAGMLAADLENEPGPCLFIDIGTNGEMVVKSGDRYYCCSTAAGPAFEGAEITRGMAAVDGAINHIKWDNTGFSYTTIGDIPAFGLCGSGLMDALAFFVDQGIVDESGRLVDPEETPPRFDGRIRKLDGKNAFWFSEDGDVFMTSEDVRKLQLAKAAIAAGIQTLLHHAGIEPEDISVFMLAGGFGSFLAPASAATIGLFPKHFLPIIKTLGNAAGEGAAIALWSKTARETLNRMRDKSEYVDLSTTTYFSEQFIDNMTFGE